MRYLVMQLPGYVLTWTALLEGRGMNCHVALLFDEELVTLECKKKKKKKENSAWKCKIVR